MQITYDEWEEKYKPIGGASPMLFDSGCTGWKFLKQLAGTNFVWTRCDDGETEIIQSGYHVANKIACYICINPFPDSEHIWVDITRKRE